MSNKIQLGKVLPTSGTWVALPNTLTEIIESYKTNYEITENYVILDSLGQDVINEFLFQLHSLCSTVNSCKFTVSPIITLDDYKLLVQEDADKTRCKLNKKEYVDKYNLSLESLVASDILVVKINGSNYDKFILSSLISARYNLSRGLIFLSDVELELEDVDFTLIGGVSRKEKAKIDKTKYDILI